MDHAANLARVQALRDDTYDIDGDHHWAERRRTLDHIEDVLTRHAPYFATAWTTWCERCGYGGGWPCPEYTSAITLLDALDGGAS